MTRSIHWLTTLALLSLFNSLACGDKDDDNGGDGGATGDGGGTGDGGTTEDMLMFDWLVSEGNLSYVFGTYGKATYCGAFEMGAKTGYEDVRCTDTASYVFSMNEDGSLRMQEAIYVHAISTQNPDGNWPWFVDHGYAGSVIWRLTPVDPALTDVDPTEAVLVEAELVEGEGPDSYFPWLASQGLKSYMILARGQADDALLDWKTRDWNPEKKVWMEYGETFPAWAIDVYPENGAFYERSCDEANRIEGATISDGKGGELAKGPGYCAPACRMWTETSPEGANDLPVCEGNIMDESPRAEALIAE